MKVSGRLHVAMLAAYAKGPLTDAEMAQQLGIDRSVVNARRNELVHAGKVRDMQVSRKNPHTGIRNATWGLVR